MKSQRVIQFVWACCASAQLTFSSDFMRTNQIKSKMSKHRNMIKKYTNLNSACRSPYIHCESNCVTQIVAFFLSLQILGYQLWYYICACNYRIYWSNWMRSAKIGVIISMITSNYIERLEKSISLCGREHTINACGMQMDDNEFIHIA